MNVLQSEHQIYEAHQRNSITQSFSSQINDLATGRLQKERTRCWVSVSWCYVLLKTRGQSCLTRYNAHVVTPALARGGWDKNLIKRKEEETAPYGLRDQQEQIVQIRPVLSVQSHLWPLRFNWPLLQVSDFLFFFDACSAVLLREADYHLHRLQTANLKHPPVLHKGDVCINIKKLLPLKSSVQYLIVNYS